MREIKCRGKRIDNGEWMAGFYVCIGEKYPYIYTGKLEINKDDVWIERYPVIPETVDQYTDIKDDNGIEIYEGDIIKVFYDNGNMDCDVLGIGEVKHHRGEWRLHGGLDDNLYDICDIHIIEVIGNIHDTTELLGE